MQYTVTLLAISCVFLVRCTENSELWKSYYKSTLSMRCRDPQERALLVTEFKDELAPMISDLELEKVSEKFDCVWSFDRKIFQLLPQSVIVKRCENSGCCLQTGYKCGAAKTKNETLPFLLNKPKRFFYLQVENHELCSCQKSKNHIK